MAEAGVEPAALPQLHSAGWEGSRAQVFACGWGKPEPFPLPCYTDFMLIRQNSVGEAWGDAALPAPLGSSGGCLQRLCPGRVLSAVPRALAGDAHSPAATHV